MIKTYDRDVVQRYKEGGEKRIPVVIYEGFDELLMQFVYFIYFDEDLNPLAHRRELEKLNAMVVWESSAPKDPDQEVEKVSSKYRPDKYDLSLQLHTALYLCPSDYASALYDLMIAEYPEVWFEFCHEFLDYLKDNLPPLDAMRNAIVKISDRYHFLPPVEPRERKDRALVTLLKGLTDADITVLAKRIAEIKKIHP